MTRLRIKSLEFRREREAAWVELEALLDQAEKSGLRGMSFRELRRLPLLYRGALSSLSVARAISLDRNLLEYLESLTGRAYICVYGIKSGLGAVFASFLARRFPAEVRAHRGLLLIAAGILVLGALTGFLMTHRNPDAFYQLVPGNLNQGRSPTSTTEELHGILFQRTSVEFGLNYFASFLFSHNAQIALLCFALGFAAGVPVFYLLFSNGQIMGAMAALYHRHGLGTDFWGWILPHGITELTAVVISGGAGLILARALILPGRRSRLEALARGGRSAGILALGAVGMLFLAAGIEGYFRQLVMNTPARFLVAAATAVLWGFYFVRVGGEPHEDG